MTNEPCKTIVQEMAYTAGWRAYLAGKSLPGKAVAEFVLGYQDAKYAECVVGRKIRWSVKEVA